MAIKRENVENRTIDAILDNRMKLTNADETLVSSNSPFAVREYSFIDTGNSSTTPLVANDSFTGTPSEITQFGVITIAVWSDQASATDGLSIEQSIDGTNWDHCDVYTIPENTGKTFSVQPMAQYFRIVYTNGAVDQTAFRLQVIQHSDYVKPSSHRIQDSITTDDDAELVKAVLTGKNPAGTFVNFQATTKGNFKISLEEFENDISVNDNTQLRVTPYDTRGDAIQVSELGELKVHEPSLVVGSPFEGTTLDPNFWTATTANNGTATTDGCLRMDTSTTANGSVSVTSVRRARKIPGTVNQFRGVGVFTTAAQADNVRTIGVYDANNGAFFKLDGTTFKVVTRSATVDTEVSSGSFNGDVSTYTVDTNVHRFVIEYTIVSVKFFIDGVLIHTVSSTTDAWTMSLNLPATVSNVNSNGNTTNNSLDMCVVCILRFGKLESEHIRLFQVGTTTGRVAKYGAGEIDGIVISAVSQNAVVSIYDGLSAAGALIWTSGTLSANTLPFDIDMKNTPFGTGLTLVISGANASVLVVYE